MKPWFDRVTNNAQIKPVADLIGMDQSTLNRQLKAGLPPETVVKIARAYKEPVVSSLVELGLISAEEAVDAAGAKLIGIGEALRLATVRQLADEISERLADLERRQNDEGDDDQGGTPAEPTSPDDSPAPGSVVANLPTLKDRERRVATPRKRAARKDTKGD